MRIASALLAIVFTAACGVSGNYASSGPCKGFSADPKACEQAAANKAVAGKLAIGQTMDEVRALFGHDAERLNADASGATWMYLTDYEAEAMTAITFVDGKVAKIATAPWKQ